MNPDWLLKHFDQISEAPDAVPRLRRFILDLAVRGKLVEQNPEDEPAKNLLKNSEQAIAIKHTKELFDFVPQGWIAVKFGQMLSLKKGKKPRLLNAENKGLPYLDIAALERNELSQFTEDMTCPQATADDLIIVCDGSRSGLVLEGREGVLGSTVAAIQFTGFSRDYLRVLLKSLYFNLNTAKKGAAIPHLNIPRFLALSTALPPLTEQHRIVAKVDELMALCDELETAQVKREKKRDRLVAATLSSISNPESEIYNPQFFISHLSRLTTRPEHIKQLRQTILNLAVRGELVPQDPKDEPAFRLIERIRTENGQQAKKGKMRGESPLPPVDEASAPFVLPSGWAWARFPELGTFGRGKSKYRPRNDPSLFENGTHLLVQTGDVARSKGLIETFTGKYNEVGLAQSVKWPKGTLCITIAANIADSGILSFDACFPDSVVGFIPATPFPNARYFEYFIRTAKAGLLEFAPATAQKNINLGILNEVLIPLPPLAEQHRIVAKVDELMALCDDIESRINNTATTRRQLLEASLSEALAIRRVSGSQF